MRAVATCVLLILSGSDTLRANACTAKGPHTSECRGKEHCGSECGSVWQYRGQHSLTVCAEFGDSIVIVHVIVRGV